MYVNLRRNGRIFISAGRNRYQREKNWWNSRNEWETRKGSCGTRDFAASSRWHWIRDARIDRSTVSRTDSSLDTLSGIVIYRRQTVACHVVADTCSLARTFTTFYERAWPPFSLLIEPPSPQKRVVHVVTTRAIKNVDTQWNLQVSMFARFQISRWKRVGNVRVWNARNPGENAL